MFMMVSAQPWCWSGFGPYYTVGGNQKEENLTVGNEKSLIGTGKLSLILTENLTDDRLSESGLRAPIKMIDGCPWSPNIYCNLRLIGKSLEVAWEKAFIRTSHF